MWADQTSPDLVTRKIAGLPARVVPFAEGSVANGGQGTMDIPGKGKKGKGSLWPGPSDGPASVNAVRPMAPAFF